MSIVKRFLVLLYAVLATTLLGSVISSFRVTSNLSELGAPIGFGPELKMALYDVQHFAPLYGIFILIAFMIAFITSAYLHRFTRLNRVVIFTVAGGAAIAVMLLAMKQVFFGVPIVAGARDMAGFMLQILCGGFGGYIYAAITDPKTA